MLGEFISIRVELKYRVSQQVQDVLYDFQLLCVILLTVLQSLVRFDSFMAFIMSSLTSEGRPERWSSFSEKSPERNFWNKF